MAFEESNRLVTGSEMAGKADKIHTHTQTENGPGVVRVNSVGGLQHLVNGVVVTEFDSSGDLFKGTVGRLARATKQLRLDASGRVQYFDTETGTVLFQISTNGQVTVGEVPWSSITGIPSELEAVKSAGALGPLTALLSHADTTTVPVFFVGSSTTQRDYPKNVVSRLAAAYPSGSSEYGTVDAKVPVVAKHTGPGVAGYNGGKGGSKSEDYIDQVILDNIALTQPVAIFHGTGSNDWAASIPLETYEANVRAAIASIDSLITKPHVHILMQQHTRYGTRLHTWGQYTDTMRRIAADLPNTVFIDLGPAIDTLDPIRTDPFGFGAGDGVHLNSLGEEVLGELMTRALGVSGGTGQPSLRVNTGVQDITSLATAGAISSGTVTFQHKNGWNILSFSNMTLSASGTVNLFANNNATLRSWAPGADGATSGSVTEAVSLGSSGADYRRVSLNHTGGLNAYGVTTGDVINGAMVWPMNRTMP